MVVLIKRPGSSAEVIKIDNKLATLQKLVEGPIECVYPFKNALGLIVNEEGKIQDKEPNFALVMDGEIYDFVAGTALIVGLTMDDFTDIPQNLIADIQTALNESKIHCIINNKLIPALEVTTF